MQQRPATAIHRFVLWGLTIPQLLLLVYWFFIDPGPEPAYTLVSALVSSVTSLLATVPLRSDPNDTTRRQPLLPSDWLWPAVVFVAVLTIAVVVTGLVAPPPRQLVVALLAVVLAGSAAVGTHYLLRWHQDVQYKRAYVRWWREERNRINTFGLRGVGEAPHVQDIFVDLRLEPGDAEHVEQRLVMSRAGRDSQQIWHFLREICRRSNQADHPVLVILGGAGFGKTTMLQHVALEFAFHKQRRHGIAERYTPILLYLREHRTTLCSKDPPPLGKLVQSYFSDPTRNLNLPENWFEQHLKAGRCLVLIDGMDEVASIEQRKQVATWIDQQISDYPESRFVVTSRPGGYKEAPLAHPRCSILAMQSFTPDQRREFLEKWYTADLSRFRKKTQQVRSEAQQKARQVLDQLRTRPALNELAGNPLLLTLIALEARDEGALPATRSDLFRRIYDLLVERRVTTRGIVELLNPKKKKELLQTLALSMMQNECTEITTAQAQPLITPKIQRLKLRQTEPDFDALNFLCTSTNLIVPAGENRWTFAHAMFREYLAALELRDCKDKAPPSWPTLVQNDWWHETLLFYAAIGDATPIIQAALELNTVPALALAARCLDETSEVDPNVKQRLSTLLRDALEDNDPQRFRLAAGVRLERRLQASESWYTLDDRRSISTDYITCAEYQLFLDEMRAEGKYYQPDHWTDFRFACGQADKPVTGMRGADAREFCAWLNARQQQGSMRYRLPTQDESRSHPASQHEPPLSAWCQDSEGHLVLDRPRPYNRDNALERVYTRIHQKNSEIGNLITRSLERALAFEIASAFDRTLARALVHAFELDLDLARARARALALARTLARTFELDLASASALAHALAHARARALALALALAHARARAHARAHARTFEIAIASVSALASELPRDLALASARDLAHEIAHDLLASAHDRALALAIASALDDSVVTALEAGDYHQAHDRLNALSDQALDAATRRRRDLLKALLNILIVPDDDIVALRKAWREYAALLLLYAWLGYRYRFLDNEQTPRQWWRWWPRRRTGAVSQDNKDTLLAAYIWLDLVQQREAGTLPAHEAIRLVRELEG